MTVGTAAFATLEARSCVAGFPLDVPCDLFDPTRVRSFAVCPLPPMDALSGALICLDHENRVFRQEQLHDLEALAFTVVGRLMPSGRAELGDRLRSLRRDLEPVTGLVRHSDRLAGRWRELSQTIDLAAAKLSGT